MPRHLLSVPSVTRDEQHTLGDPAAEMVVMLQGDMVQDGPMRTALTNEELTRACQLLNYIAGKRLLDGSTERDALLQYGIQPHTNDDLKKRAADAVAYLNMFQAAKLLGDLRMIDCPLPASILMQHAAALMCRCSGTEGLRTLLGEADDLSPADKAAALAEPLFTPPDGSPQAEGCGGPSKKRKAPGSEAMAHAVPLAHAAQLAEDAACKANADEPPTPTEGEVANRPPMFGLTIADAMDAGIPDEGNTLGCLTYCDARTLRELKAVSAAWRRRARDTLGVATSAWRKNPVWSTSKRGDELVAQPASKYFLGRMAEELDSAVELPAYATKIVECLMDDDKNVRWAAVETLGKLDPVVLAQAHATKIVEMLGPEYEADVAYVAVRVLGQIVECLRGDQIAQIVECLMDDDRNVRWAAVETLGKLDPVVLAQAHAAEIVEMLSDDNEEGVREVAVVTLGKLDPARVDFAVIVAKLADDNEGVRKVVVETLHKLDPAVLAHHATSIAAKLTHNNAGVRRAVVLTLDKLEPVFLAKPSASIIQWDKDETEMCVHTQALHLMCKLQPQTAKERILAIVARLEHEDERVCEVALVTLRKLEPAVLAQHAAAIAAKLTDQNHSVWEAALVTLGKLEPAVLAQHAAAVVAKLADEPGEAAVQTLYKLEPAVLAEYDATIATNLRHVRPRVIQAALVTFGKLEPAVIAQHADAVASLLKGGTAYIRKAARETLMKLEPEVRQRFL